MVSTPSPPSAPDPTETAKAQGQMNKETAIAQYGLNATNQVTPYGTLSYEQTGKWEDGTPRFTATTALSPEQQKLYELGTQTQQNLGQLGVDQSAKVTDILNSPFDLNSAISTQQGDIATKLLDPVWKQREDALAVKLANQGISPGSEAYTTALRDFGMQRDNAYNSALLTGRGQAATEALTQRNQPLNEITALMGGSQVAQPNFASTPQTSIQPPDYQGAVAQNYAGQLSNYNQKIGQQNAMMGGLFGLAAAPLGGWAYGGFKTSDRRLKKDIRRVGKADNGLPIYLFRYKGDDEIHLGLMAQDVEKVRPEAVTTISGYKAVHYPKALEVH